MAKQAVDAIATKDGVIAWAANQNIVSTGTVQIIVPSTTIGIEGSARACPVAEFIITIAAPEIDEIDTNVLDIVHDKPVVAALRINQDGFNIGHCDGEFVEINP